MYFIVWYVLYKGYLNGTLLCSRVLVAKVTPFSVNLNSLLGLVSVGFAGSMPNVPVMFSRGIS